MKNTIVVINKTEKKATRISRGMCIQIIRKQTGKTKKGAIDLIAKTNSNYCLQINGNKAFALKNRDYHRIYSKYGSFELMGV